MSGECTAQDLEAIAELHRADQQASLAADYATLEASTAPDTLAGGSP